MDPRKFLLNARVIVTLVARLLLSPVAQKLCWSMLYSRVGPVLILEHYVASKLVAAVGEAFSNAYSENMYRR
jgi:hypothetical protein